MTFSVLRALHSIIGEALDDIEAVYALHASPDKSPTDVCSTWDKVPTSEPPGNSPSSRLNHRPTLSINSFANVYASPPPSPCIKTEASSESLRQPTVDFPSLDAPYNPTSLAETLTQHPDVVAATNRIIAACGQMTATVQTPFLTLCDAVMGYHLPSCMRLFEASHTPEILREAGLAGSHVDAISEKNGVDKIKLAHILRLLATHHIVTELSPDVFTLNRISSTIDTGKCLDDIHQWTMQGIPEEKYADTSGVAAFVGLCSDEIFKSSAFLTETYLLSQSRITRAGSEPTRAPFCFAFGTVESQTGYFGWLEGSLEPQSVSVPTADIRPETGRCALYAPVKPRKMSISGVRSTEHGPTLSRDVPNANRFRLERFGKAMSGTCSWETPGAIMSGFDWHSLPQGSVVVDVGGGIGSTSMFLAGAFPLTNQKGPSLRFIIQDRPTVVEMGEKAWRAKCPELLDNGTVLFQVHDFFAPQPVKQAAVFLLRVVLHDWPDDFARRILLHLREAAMPNTKLLLGDFILPLACPDEVHGDEHLEGIQGAESTLAPFPLLPNLGKASANAYWMDMTMQAMFNAQERTLREIAVLVASAGWKVTSVSKCSNSLFGYIVAIPSTKPSQTHTAFSSAISYRDPAFLGHGSPNASVERPQSRVKPSEREIIERSSSRCGTPTFGSRTQLSLFEEVLSKFGGAFLRSRKHGTPVATRPAANAKTTLKHAVTLTPVPAAKKTSPLSSPTPLTAPSPASPTTKSPSSPRASTSTLGQRIIPRRLSLANLRVSASHDAPPLPNPRAPPSPMSPRLSLPRKSSVVQMSNPGNQRNLEGPATVRSESTSMKTSSPAVKQSTFQGYRDSSLTSSSYLGVAYDDGPSHLLASPSLSSTIRTTQQSPGRTRTRRSSLAQLVIPPSTATSSDTVFPSSLQPAPKVEMRKRTKSTAGFSTRATQQANNAVAFFSDLGTSLGTGLETRVGGGPSRLGGLLSRSGGGTNLRSEKSRDVAMPGALPDFPLLIDPDVDGPAIQECGRNRKEPGQENVDREYEPADVLATATQIEKKVSRRKGSPLTQDVT